MEYLRHRGKPMLIGFVIGIVVGSLQPFAFPQASMVPMERAFLAFQMGASFAIMGVFLASYFEMRQRIVRRYREDIAEQSVDGGS